MSSLPSATDRASLPADQWMDVWSRSGSKYRVRAVLLMLANILLFAGVGSFAFWLRSGEMFAPAREGYWDLLFHTFRGVGLAEVSLGSLLVDPISVQDVPMQIPIVGLLMAALISIPILVAILYRFWSSLPLIAVVGFVAVMPWLAITLLASCGLASTRLFRTRFRFMSALIGLVPAVIYLTLAWAGTTDAVVGKIDPVDRIRFVAPWVMAVVAATIVFAVVLSIAKLVNYRPGAVTPLLAMMFALPVALFEFHVGRDELYYRLLENLDRVFFTEVDAATAWEPAAERAWESHPLPKPSRDELRQAEGEKWLFELAADPGPRQAELTRHQSELAYRCDSFHHSYPDSRYAPCAFFIKARGIDRRIDEIEFRRTKWIRFYDDFPGVASREAWRIVLANRAESPMGAVAALRLAQLEARECDLDRAIEKLEAILSRFDLNPPDASASATRGLWEGMLERESPEQTLRIPMERILLKAHALKDLLTSNRDPRYGDAPLCGSKRPEDAFRIGLLDLDPRHELYVENLEALRVRYPQSRLEDNIELELANAAAPLADRIEKLESLLGRFPGDDAAPEAMVRLATAYGAAGRAAQSDELMSRLVREHANSIWARSAGRSIRLPAGDQVSEVDP